MCKGINRDIATDDWFDAIFSTTLAFTADYEMWFWDLSTLSQALHPRAWRSNYWNQMYWYGNMETMLIILLNF